MTTAHAPLSTDIGGPRLAYEVARGALKAYVAEHGTDPQDREIRRKLRRLQVEDLAAESAFLSALIDAGGEVLALAAADLTDDEVAEVAAEVKQELAARRQPTDDEIDRAAASQAVADVFGPL